jgi:uncharacterized protein YbjT (DUF2867 family)
MARVVVAGATGYIGKFVVRELARRGHRVRALTRSKERLGASGPFTAPAVSDLCDEVFVGEATRPETLEGLFEGAELAFSSVGISRQRDGLSFERVDHQANRALIERARDAGVKKFVYVSLWDPEQLARLEIVRAHEQVVEALAQSGMEYTVVRPSGYFSDMGVLLDMARRGRAFVVGSGENRMNPIHGADVAEVCAAAFEHDAREVGCGGPDILTQNQAAELAFEVLGKKPKLTHLPPGMLRGVVWGVRALSKQFGDLADFLVTAGEVDGVAPQVGKITLRQYFEELAHRPGSARPPALASERVGG